MGHRQREILCIDDDSQSLKVRGILLESMGYKVWSEPDAEHGLRAFKDHEVDAVVMDYEMPGMNGADAALEMKRLRPEVPVLILSALPWLPEGAPYEAIDGFIQKGEPLRVLAGKIEQVMASESNELANGIAPAVENAVGSFVGQLKATLRMRRKAGVF